MVRSPHRLHRLCGAVARLGILAAAVAQPDGRRGAVGDDAARRQHHPRGGPQHTARLRPHPGLGVGQFYCRRAGERRPVGRQCRPGYARQYRVSAGARRFGPAAGRVFLDPVGAGHRRPRALGGARPVCRRPSFLAVRRQRLGAAVEPSSSIRIRHALLARSRLLRRSLARYGPKASSPRSCCSGKARRWWRAWGRSA